MHDGWFKSLKELLVKDYSVNTNDVLLCLFDFQLFCLLCRITIECFEYCAYVITSVL